MRKNLFIVVLFALILSLSSLAFSKEIDVVFLNPGESSEKGTGSFWRMVSDFMEEASDDLDINLEVIFSERNHIKMKEQARELAKRSNKPDYVVIVNEKSVGDTIINDLKNSGIKIMVIHNTITDAQKEKIGKERDRVKNWIGSITSDNTGAGYKLMEELAKYSSNPEVIAISGNRATPVSNQRENGMKNYVKENGLKLRQVFYGEWQSSRGEEIAGNFLKRNKSTNIVWTANDAMGEGAYKGASPIKNDIIVGGMGGFAGALKSIENDGMKATIGGHFMIGAWALVLIYDYENSIDFADSEGTDISFDYLFIINKKNIGQYKENIVEKTKNIDFKKFTKTGNSKLMKYNFSYENIIKNSK
jgi:ABC-type sugar transport system substrate-binding protein